MQRIIPLQDTVLVSGDVIATNITYKEFLRRFDIVGKLADDRIQEV